MFERGVVVVCIDDSPWKDPKPNTFFPMLLILNRLYRIKDSVIEQDSQGISRLYLALDEFTAPVVFNAFRFRPIKRDMVPCSIEFKELVKFGQTIKGADIINTLTRMSDNEQLRLFGNA